MIIAHGKPKIIEPRVPMTRKNWAKRIFRINGNESSIIFVSEENRFSILPREFTSKNEVFA